MIGFGSGMSRWMIVRGGYGCSGCLRFLGFVGWLRIGCISWGKKDELVRLVNTQGLKHTHLICDFIMCRGVLIHFE